MVYLCMPNYVQNWHLISPFWIKCIVLLTSSYVFFGSFERLQPVPAMDILRFRPRKISLLCMFIAPHSRSDNRRIAHYLIFFFRKIGSDIIDKIVGKAQTEGTLSLLYQLISLRLIVVRLKKNPVWFYFQIIKAWLSLKQYSSHFRLTNPDPALIKTSQKS